jgi:predicted metal-dependent peptidase
MAMKGKTVGDQLAIARQLIRKSMPYVEPELQALQYVHVPNYGKSFSANEKRQIFHDEARTLAIAPEELAADIAHEILVHLMPDHFGMARTQCIPDEHRRLWNELGDAIGNVVLREVIIASGGRLRPFGHVVKTKADFETCGFVTVESVLKRYGLTHADVDPIDGNAETVSIVALYRAVIAKLAQQPPPPQQPQQGGQGKPQQGQQQSKPQSGQGEKGEGDPQDGEGDGEGEGGAQSPQSGQGGGSKPVPVPPKPAGQRSCGGCAGDTEHTDKLADDAKASGQSLPNGYTPDEVESIRKQTAEAVKKHAEQGRGDMPAGLKQWAEEVLKPPKVDWRARLASITRRGIGIAKGATDFTMTKPSRVGAHFGMVLPSLFKPKVRVGLVFDTSGSMGSKSITDSICEVVGILKAGGVEEAYMVACDVRPTTPVKLKDGSQVVGHIRDQLVGGGGTDMGAGVAQVAKVKPHLTFVLTDGDTGWPATKPQGAGEVVVVLVRKSSSPTPAWARDVVEAFDDGQ